MARHTLILGCFSCILVTVFAELLQVNMVFRHGDRAPVDIYPKDEHTAEQWPNGLAMLTQIGKEQQTRLGLFLRDRYDALLSKRYNVSEIYVRSSSIDRTLVSAYSNLAGLYAYNSSTVQWQGNYVSWQPVPVQTVPGYLDEVLRMNRSCAKYAALREEETGDAMNKIRADYADMIKLMLTLSGYSEDDGYGHLRQLSHIADTLYCERAHNLSWPDWATWKNMTCASGSDVSCAGKTVYQILRDLQTYGFYNQTIHTKSLHEFIGGPLVMLMLDNMNDKLTKEKATPNVFMYSAHDVTVAAFLAALGAYNGLQPQYTATALVELHKEDGVEDHIVKVFYKNITDNNTVYPLDITDCGSPCTLTKFNEIYQSYKIANWDDACKNFAILSEEEIVTLSICLTVLVTMSLAAVICYTRRRKISDRYMRVRTA